MSSIYSVVVVRRSKQDKSRWVSIVQRSVPLDARQIGTKTKSKLPFSRQTIRLCLFRYDLTLTPKLALWRYLQLTRSSAVTDKPPDLSCISYFIREQRWYTLYSKHCVPMPFHWRPQWWGSPRAIGFMGVGKLEWLGYKIVKVAWWSTQSFGHNTSTW